VNYLTSNESYTDPSSWVQVTQCMLIMPTIITLHFVMKVSEVPSGFIYLRTPIIYINNSHNEIIVSLHYGGCTHWFYYFRWSQYCEPLMYSIY